MKKFIPVILFVVVVSIAATIQPGDPVKMKYPVTRKTDTIDTYFGTKIPDPYRWLEDDKSAETGAWVKEQNNVTFDYLAKIPFRNKLKERLTKIWNFEKVSSPFKKGKNYFFYKNNGIQNQAVLYVQNGRILLDPNTLAADGTASLGGLASARMESMPLTVSTGQAATGVKYTPWRLKPGKNSPMRSNG
jgi:prolyl oligopeptidase